MYKYADKYKNAENILRNNSQVDTWIGHSAGGTTVLELNKNYNNKYKTRTYSAPVFDIFKNNSVNDNNLRFKTQGDVVATFDKNAIPVDNGAINPLSLHAYGNYGDLGKSTKGINYQIM